MEIDIFIVVSIYKFATFKNQELFWKKFACNKLKVLEMDKRILWTKPNWFDSVHNNFIIFIFNSFF